MASKRRLRRTCERKITYATQQAAFGSLLAQAGKARRFLSPYRCERCRKWHLARSVAATLRYVGMTA